MPKATEIADYNDWTGWSATSKGWNYHKPFHRINSPFFDLKAGPQADGNGLRCGCRNEIPPGGGFPVPIIGLPTGKLFELFLKQIMQTIPNWVPVQRDPENDYDREVREVEGIILRSIHSYTDQPFTQYHNWYDWNFHIDPAPGFRTVLGPANEGPVLSGEQQKHGLRAVLRPWYKENLSGIIECEWDLGGFAGAQVVTSDGKAQIRSGPMFETDCAWPMTGQYIWIEGRWIYDCGHPKPGDLMHTELHPCKTVATARWEAVKFDENGDLYVPAIQFMFFASLWGGYIDFRTIHDRDYEFIVDLPVLDTAPIEYAIGHTPHYPRNTLVPRRNLLKRFDYPFDKATDASKPKVQPIVELVEPFDPAKPQAKITIPLASAPEFPKLSAYGVIISLGWWDPDQSQARKVKKCTVSLQGLRNSHIMKHRRFFPNEPGAPPNSELGLFDPGTWRVRLAVNGRWFARDFEIGPSSTLPLALNIPKIELYLSEEDALSFSVNGFIERTQGAFMVKRDIDYRKLRFEDGTLIQWQEHIVSDETPQGKAITRKVFDVLKRRGPEILTGFPPHTDENFPLGFLDPYVNADQENPLPADQNISGSRKVLWAPYSLDVDDDILENLGLVDYLIEYTVTIEPQKV